MPKPLRTLNVADLEKLKEVYHRGGQDVEVCKALGISLKHFNKLMDTDPDFAEIVEFGRLYMKAWWVQQGRDNLQNKQFNQNLWAFQMKNLFGWSEKAETINKSDNGEPRNLKEAEDQLREALKEFGGIPSEESLAAMVEQESRGNH